MAGILNSKIQEKYGISVYKDPEGRLSKEISKENWFKLVAAFPNKQECATALHIDRNWLRRQEKKYRHGWTMDRTAQQYRMPNSLEATMQQKAQQNAQQNTKAQLTEAVRKIDTLEKQLTSFTELHKTKPHIIKIRKKVPHNTTEATALALVSDFHVGEVVISGSINHLNAYNPDICKARVIKLFQSIVRLTEIERGGVKIPVLNLYLLGDIIHGFIHPEYRQTNSMPPTKEMLFAFELLVSGIEFLLKQGGFQQIHVICKPGNHARITEKFEVNTASYNSYEWVIYQFLAEHFKNRQNIKFYIPEANIFYTEVYGKVIRCLHGNEIRYAGGVGGITIPMNKAIAQWDKAKRADLTIMGHWHHFMDMGNAVVNGCFAAGSLVTLGDGARKPIEDVKEGEHVLTRTGETKPVVHTLKRRHNGRLISLLFQGHFNKIRCTPNHEFWAIKRNQMSQLVQQAVHDEEGKTSYKESQAFAQPSWVPAAFLSEGDYLHVPHITDTTDAADTSSEFCRLLGYYLAEGSVSGPAGSKRHVDFTFHVKEKEYADFVQKALIEKFGRATQRVPRLLPTSRTVTLNDTAAASLFVELCGKGCEHKRMVESLMHLPLEKQEQLFLGWLQGDGCVSQGIWKCGRYRDFSRARNVCIATVSLALASQMHQIALRLGFAPKLYSTSPGGSKKRRAYQLKFTADDAMRLGILAGRPLKFEDARETKIGMLKINGELFVPISQVWSERFEGAVYDLEVRGEHSYVVNGVTVHNSVIGYNQYAESIKADYEVPQQAFILIDSKHGKQDCRPLFLND